MVIPVLPNNAPFSESQRSWLNGFFAGLVSRAGGTNGNGSAPNTLVPAANGDGAAALAPTAAPAAAGGEEMPWHDPALSLDERMQMATGKPYARRLMAAMAQLDCGACGYLCQTYSEAIAAGTRRA
jgi:sulfite reductase (NADPH) flavoprotein alpha-component